MELFRKLADSIFFKIILAFVALSFVLFGVSGFILGTPNSWVAKVGDETVSYSQFNAALRSDREIVIASSGKSEEAIKYLESDRFKSDVLGRIVNQKMIKKLSKDFDVTASKKVILESIAKDPNFRNESGKFDHKKFEQFLVKNGLNEEKYVDEISNGISATMILQSLSLSTPISDDVIARTESFKQEKRVADVITISAKDVATSKLSEEEIEKFFKENQSKYVSPELRKVSYLTFSKKDFVRDLQISDQEIAAEYEKEKDHFTKPETRSFYNVVFEKEADAKNFRDKLDAIAKADKSKTKPGFEKLAKELAKKDLKGITLAYVAQRDLVAQIGEPIFKLALNEYSQVISSPLGFHVFLLNDIKKPQLIPFAEVKNSLKEKLSKGREEKVLQDKISAIGDSLLSSNSLSEVAKKFNLKLASSAVVIDQSGRNTKGEEVSDIKGLANFSENVFALKEKQASKVFAAENSEGFYAFYVDEVTPSKQLNLSEAKSRVVADLSESRKQDALRDLARKVGEEVKKDPNSIAKIAASYRLKVEKAREFPRVVYLNFQGQKLPYQDQFLKDLFVAKVGEATAVSMQSDDRFVVAVLREIKKIPTNLTPSDQLRAEAREEFRNEIMSEYNAYLLALYPVKTNDKVFGKPSKEEE